MGRSNARSAGSRATGSASSSRMRRGSIARPASGTKCCARSSPELPRRRARDRRRRTPTRRRSTMSNRGDRRHPLIWSGVIHHDFQSSTVPPAQHLRDRGDDRVRLAAARRCRAAARAWRGDVELSATVAWVVGRHCRPALHQSRSTCAAGQRSARGRAGAVGAARRTCSRVPRRTRRGTSNGTACRSASCAQSLEGFMKR